MTATPFSVIVGDRRDPHVAAVLDQCADRHPTPVDMVVLDAATVTDQVVRLDAEGIELRTETGHAPVNLRATSGRPLDSDRTAGRGWIRRLAPAAWDDGVRIGSREAASAASRLMTLATLIRTGPIQWLTDVDPLFAAENKAIQYLAAAATGVAVPAWALTTSPEAIAGLGPRIVLKPLGPGHYSENGERRIVYVNESSPDALTDVDVAASPFIVQTVVTARSHLRIVTVQDQAWVAELQGDGLPIDWRQDEQAHRTFEHSNAYPEIAAHARSLAAVLGCGFTSQDWIVADDGHTYFVDLNPGGQWLFLPSSVADAVTDALASWLTQR